MIPPATVVALPWRHARFAPCRVRSPAALLGLLALLVTPGLNAAEVKPATGLIVQVPTPITSESTGRLRSLLHGPLKRFEQTTAREGGRFVLICDFNPNNQRSECDDFGASHSLAAYLRSLRTDVKGVRTVAYVHADVRRHSVLPVLACSEIVFSEKGRLGQVAATGKPLGDTEQAAYREFTRNRYPEVLVRKTYDANLHVSKVGDRYVAGEKGDPVPGLNAGELAFYTFEQARSLGLAQQHASATLDEVRIAAGLPRNSLKRTLDRANCWRIPLEGPITGELVEQSKRRIERAIRGRANLILLDIRCVGGDPERASELGHYLASLAERRPDNPIETIAYLNSKARDLSVFLAFGCDMVIMQRESEDDKKDLNPDDEDDSLPGEARLGGFTLYFTRHPSVEPLRKALEGTPPGPNRDALEKRLQDALSALEEPLRANLVDLARKQMYPTAIAEGLFSRELEIHVVERARGATGGRAYLTGEELKADQQGKKLWRSVGLVKPWQGQPRYQGRYLTLTARQARDLGIAQAVVKDLPELYEIEGLTQAQVKSAEADWLDGLADFLRDPWTSVILIMVGITCLILELKMPGVGLPGVVSAICFVLFFWAHSQLNGQITWLAILLFILGLILIGLEVFVLPGFGVCGIGGTLLVLASLGLVAYGHWPRSSEEWIGFGNKLGPFGISLMGSLVGVFLMVRYLPYIPVLNRLMLRSQEEGEDGAGVEEHPLHAEMQALLGAIGVAATPLRPAGKTQFGEEFVDVVAEGGYIMPGTRVRVIEVEGNRVVVKEV